MAPGAEDRAGGRNASRGGRRVWLALGVSGLLHGLVALALAGESSAPPVRPEPDGPPLEVALVWREPAAAAGAPEVAAPAPAPRRTRSPGVKPPSRKVERKTPEPVEEAREGFHLSPVTSETEGEARPEPVEGAGEGFHLSPVTSETEGPGSGPGGSGPGGVGGRGEGEGVEAALLAYREQLSRRVTRQRRYPAQAVRLGLEGTATVRVRVGRDGGLVEPPRLEASSRFRVLDVEALRMVEAAAPFAPLPEGVVREPLEFVIPVSFSLRAAAG